MRIINQTGDWEIDTDSIDVMSQVRGLLGFGSSVGIAASVNGTWILLGGFNSNEIHAVYNELLSAKRIGLDKYRVPER